jgi:propionyl-CoA synthetase
MYERSINPSTREAFWKEEAEKVHWSKFPTKILDNTNEYLPRWYPDGEINICYNAIDRHVVAGHGDSVAIIWDSAYLNIV